MRQFGAVSRDGSDTGSGPPAQVPTQPPHSQYKAIANPSSAGDLPQSHRGPVTHLLARAYRKARQGPRAFSIACFSFVIRGVPLRLWREARRLVMPAQSSAAVASRGRPSHGAHASPDWSAWYCRSTTRPSFLAGSIESVLAQTYPDFELIIINDGSTRRRRSGPGPLLRSSPDPHPHAGQPEAPQGVQQRIQFAQGEFWTWTSADNLMHPQPTGAAGRLSPRSSRGGHGVCRLPGHRRPGRTLERPDLPPPRSHVANLPGDSPAALRRSPEHRPGQLHRRVLPLSRRGLAA